MSAAVLAHPLLLGPDACPHLLIDIDPRTGARFCADCGVVLVAGTEDPEPSRGASWVPFAERGTIAFGAEPQGSGNRGHIEQLPFGLRQADVRERMRAMEEDARTVRKTEAAFAQLSLAPIEAEVRAAVHIARREKRERGIGVPEQVAGAALALIDWHERNGGWHPALRPSLVRMAREMGASTTQVRMFKYRVIHEGIAERAATGRAV